MPILAFLSVVSTAFAILFAIHAVRNQQPLYWLFVLLAFPGFGSLIYFFAVYYPNSQLSVQAQRTVKSIGKMLDSERELRESKQAFDFTPTAQNRLRLADAYLANNQAEQALVEYKACLQGIYADDLNIHMSAAKAAISCKDGEQALVYLQFIIDRDKNFYPQQILILFAEALMLTSRESETAVFFNNVLRHADNFEAKVTYGLWAQRQQLPQAAEVADEIEKTIKHWTKASRQYNAKLIAVWRKHNPL